MEFVEAPADVVRSIIAHTFLESQMSRLVNPRLGDVTLREHQIEAVQFAKRAIDEFGGVFIGDDVGLGKTYVALSLASNYSRIAVTAPAVLREMWRSAGQSTNVHFDFISFESLSRDVKNGTYQFVIIDEAHHVRNPATNRYANLVKLTRGCKVALLSATPIHNKGKDLNSLLAIFLGARSLNDEELSRCIVRREHTGHDHGIPVVLPTIQIKLPSDDTFLEKILALPPAIPLRNSGEAVRLTTLGLVRQWASSDAALRGALRRRLARATSLTHALQSGRYPSSVELRAWVMDDNSVQLAFPELMVQETDLASSHRDGKALLQTIEEHSDALRELVCSIPDRDSYRVSELRKLRALHCKIIAFSQYSDTVEHLFRLLQNDGGVAMLTASGGRIASGPVKRSDVLAQLYSNSPVDRVNLLITTDLLSEGVNLQAADAVVHLDLPWTPARLKQRVGRVARMGSEHRTVSEYKILPPASAEAVIRAELILKVKIAITDKMTAAANAAERAREIMRAWQGKVKSLPTPVAGAVRYNTSGFVAVVKERRHAEIVSDMQEIPTSYGAPVQIDPQKLEEAKRKLAEWVSNKAAIKRAAPSSIAIVRKKILNRIDAIVAGTPLHARHKIMQEVQKARNAAMQQVGAAVERDLAELAKSEMPDNEWLNAIVNTIVGEGVSPPSMCGSTLAKTACGGDRRKPVPTNTPDIPALLIFQTDSG